MTVLVNLYLFVLFRVPVERTDLVAPLGLDDLKNLSVDIPEAEVPLAGPGEHQLPARVPGNAGEDLALFEIGHRQADPLLPRVSRQDRDGAVGGDGQVGARLAESESAEGLTVDNVVRFGYAVHAFNLRVERLEG